MPGRPDLTTLRRLWIAASSGLPLLPRAERVATAVDGPTLVVVAANLERGEKDPRRQAEAVVGLDADVLLLVEHTPATRDALIAAGLATAFPHLADDVDPGYFGSLVASRRPIGATRAVDLGGRPGQLVDLDVDGTEVRVVPVHTQAPIFDRDVDVWHATVEATAAVADAAPGPVVLAGDWNATGGHRRFRGALRRHRLADASAVRGRRWYPTWPVDAPLLGLRPPPLLTLDHVVVSDDVEVIDLARLDLPGSDHKGLRAVLRLPRQPSDPTSPDTGPPATTAVTWGVSCESGVRIGEAGASPARTQDDAPALSNRKDEDTAGGVPGRRDVRHDVQDTP